MKRHKQVNESKELIYYAFRKLLDHRDFDGITLSEIAALAGVGRTTLYRHFKEKEDILLYRIEKELKDKFSNEFTQRMPSLAELLEFRFLMIKDNPNVVLLMKSGKLDTFVKDFHVNYKQHVKTMLQGHVNQYDLVFMNAGIDAITKLWIENDMKESCKTMALLCIELIERVTAFPFERKDSKV